MGRMLIIYTLIRDRYEKIPNGVIDLLWVWGVSQSGIGFLVIGCNGLKEHIWNQYGLGKDLEIGELDTQQTPDVPGCQEMSYSGQVKTDVLTVAWWCQHRCLEYVRYWCQAPTSWICPMDVRDLVQDSSQSDIGSWHPRDVLWIAGHWFSLDQ